MGEEQDVENTNSPRQGVGLLIDKRINKKPPWAVFCLRIKVIFVIVFPIECVVQLAPPWRGEVERCKYECVVQW